MKKRIGFIDYHIDEWHANNYPNWIKSAKRADEFEFFMAFEESAGPGRSLQAWCDEFGVKAAASIEEVVASCDALFVLAPSNPEHHERLANLALKSGKPTYIDKPFANSLESAQRMFALAKEYNTPMFSSSALRFGTELQKARINFANQTIDTMLTWGGGSNYNEYAIHQLEMIISTMGMGVERIMRKDSANGTSITLEYKNARSATLSFNPKAAFGCTILGDQSIEVLPTQSTVFENMMDAILEFFATGKSPVPSAETIEIVRILEQSIKAFNQKEQWINL